MNERLTIIIGIIAGVCTSLSLLPQFVKIIKEKKANDISLFYLLILFVGLVLWIIYGSRKEDLPIIITNGVALALNILIILAGIWYKKREST